MSVFKDDKLSFTKYIFNNLTIVKCEHCYESKELYEGHDIHFDVVIKCMDCWKSYYESYIKEHE
jgi:hypothetical protein